MAHMWKLVRRDVALNSHRLLFVSYINHKLERFNCARLLLEKIEAALESVTDVSQCFVSVDEQQSQSEGRATVMHVSTNTWTEAMSWFKPDRNVVRVKLLRHVEQVSLGDVSRVDDDENVKEILAHVT